MSNRLAIAKFILSLMSKYLAIANSGLFLVINLFKSELLSLVSNRLAVATSSFISGEKFFSHS